MLIAGVALGQGWYVGNHDTGPGPNQSLGVLLIGSGLPSGSCVSGGLYVDSSTGNIWPCQNNGYSTYMAPGASTPIPSGSILMISSGSCPSGFTENDSFNGVMPYGTEAANGDVGGTGGANTITPTVASLTAAAQSFTGSAATSSATSAGTPSGTNASGGFSEGAISYPANVPTIAAGIFTQPTVSWPAGVPTFAGNALATHTHTVTPTGTNGAVSVATTSGSLAGTSAGAFSKIATVSPGSSFTVGAETFTGSQDTTSAVSGGTPAGTVAWPAGVPMNASGAFSEGAISWPANPPTIAAGNFTQPTFTGNALATHTHTLTATGTNGTSAVTGTLNSFDNRPAYLKVIFCQKT